MNLISKKYISGEDNPTHGGKRISQFANEKEKKPLVSLITVVKNNDRHLEETIQSVLNQSFKNFEYILIDGNSDDNTIKIIKKYEDQINYWISETDDGIYFAFNKGLEYARGELIGFVNSDDILKQNALEILSNYYRKYPEIDFLFGAVKKHWAVLYGYKPKKIKWSWGFYSSHSTGFFIKKEAAKKVGYYNTIYKYHSDYDYFFRMIVKYKLKGIGTKKNEIFGIFRRGGFSSKIPFKKLFMEEMKIRYDNKQNFLLLAIIFFYKFLKHFWKLFK